MSNVSAHSPDLDAPSSPAWQKRLAQAGLAFGLLLACVRYGAMERTRVLEFDQICTLFAATAPSWRVYLAAMATDGQPPFSHLATRIGLALPLPQTYGLHAVSLLTALLTALCVYLLFRRRGAPLAALAAAAWCLASRSMEWALTVRPYAALMLVAALGLLCYDTYSRRRAMGQRPNLWPLTLTIVFGASVHALGIIYALAPVAAGEVLYWRRTNRIDRRLWLGVLLASTSFIFDVNLAHQVQRKEWLGQMPMSARIPGMPTVAKLVQVLTIPVERRWQMLILPAVLIATVLLRRRVRSEADSPAAAPLHSHSAPVKLHPASLQASAVGFEPSLPAYAAIALYGAGLVAFAMGAANHYFFPRYASPVYLCAPLLLGAALADPVWRRFKFVPAALSAFFLLLPLLTLRAILRDSSSPRQAYPTIFAHSNVVASPLSFPTLWWYATPAERAQMHMVTDPDHYKHVIDGIPEQSLLRFQSIGALPFQLTPLDHFRTGDEVYIVHPLQAGDLWLPTVLAQQGFHCVNDTNLHSQVYAADLCTRAQSASQQAAQPTPNAHL